MKTAFAIPLFVVSALAQNSPAIGAYAACGPLGVSFNTTISAGRPITHPEPGKAIVYVAEDPKVAGITPTIKLGLDGKWVGAMHGASHLFLAVDPGEHHLCVNWQSSLKGRSRLVSFAHVVAEPGKTYYFRARVIYSKYDPDTLDLDAIDPDEGEYLVSSSPLSTAHPKK